MVGNGKGDKICAFIEDARYHGQTSCPGPKYNPEFKVLDTENNGVRIFPESDHEVKKARNNPIRKNHSVAPCDYNALDAFKHTVRDETNTTAGSDKAEL